MDKCEFKDKPCYLDNRVVREPCKQRTACIKYCETYWKRNDRLELSTVLEIIYGPETGHIIHYSLPLVY